MAEQLSIGDTVKLKSGGPIMTVETAPQNYAGVPKVYCTWFEGKKHNKQSFAVGALEKADPNREPVL